MPRTTNLLAASIGVLLLALPGCGRHRDDSGQSRKGLWTGIDCTLTQGYWKNHCSAWPVSALTLGTVTYTQAELLLILGQPVEGNELLALAHQLIAARLNVAKSASDTAIAGTLADADTLIAGEVVPPIGTGWLDAGLATGIAAALDRYNNGTVGPGHCGSLAADEICDATCDAVPVVE